MHVVQKYGHKCNNLREKTEDSCLQRGENGGKGTGDCYFFITNL